MIHIYDNYEIIDNKILDSLICSLPYNRKAKALSFKNNVDKISCAVSYKLLCYGLKKNME